MRITLLLSAILFTLLSFAEATPHSMRPISPLYVDVYGFDKHQMEYIRESKTKVVTIDSDSATTEYHYNSNYNLKRVIEKNSRNKIISEEIFKYNETNQLTIHTKTLYKGFNKYGYDVYFLEILNITSLIIANDTFKYNNQGNIYYASRIGSSTIEPDEEWYPRFATYPYKMTIKLENQNNDSLIYSCNIDSTYEKYITCPSLFYIVEGQFIGYENHLCKTSIEINNDTTSYRIKRFNDDGFSYFTWETYIVTDSSNNSTRLYGYGNWLPNYDKMLVQKAYNSEGILISRLDCDYWGRQDTTIYIRNKDNNRIESISIHYKNVYTYYYLNKDPKTNITESFEKLKFSYQ